MIESKLRAVFQRVFRCDLPGSNFSPADIEAWDSLSHIKLVMELEREFSLTIDSENIPSLYSDFETIRAFVTKNE